ncbi:hypothetical protein [Paenibacillus pinihumi]|uniref:hypothetical protein n=1 Tax=Paenibacillus pinihumi TaxID=669462 RepID=UPI00042072F5|nr:hypothetical protein [Paenibacillus pinihumi]
MIIILLAVFMTGCASNNQYYAEENSWKVSPLFVSGPYTMIGKEGRVGFIYNDTEVNRFYPGKQQKYIWHFWGSDPQESQALQGKELKITAVSKATGQRLELMKTKVQRTGTYYAQSEIWDNEPIVRVPSLMSLPTPGLWRLDAFIGEQLFGSVVVRVHERA